MTSLKHREEQMDISIVITVSMMEVRLALTRSLGIVSGSHAHSTSSAAAPSSCDRPAVCWSHSTTLKLLNLANAIGHLQDIHYQVAYQSILHTIKATHLLIPGLSFRSQATHPGFTCAARSIVSLQTLPHKENPSKHQLNHSVTTPVFISHTPRSPQWQAWLCTQ
jgi:hypothetical protein